MGNAICAPQGQPAMKNATTKSAAQLQTACGTLVLFTKRGAGLFLVVPFGFAEVFPNVGVGEHGLVGVGFAFGVNGESDKVLLRQGEGLYSGGMISLFHGFIFSEILFGFLEYTHRLLAGSLRCGRSCRRALLPLAALAGGHPFQ